MMNHTLKNVDGKSFEVDVFIPSRSLAFEYNGEYHYKFVSMYQRA